MHLGDLLPTANIWQTHHDLAVESPGAKQRRVKHIRTVGRCYDDDAVITFEPIHFDQQLVQGLFPLIVTAA